MSIVKSTFCAVELALLSATSLLPLAAQQPTVTSVVNAASHAAAGPNAPVAQGSLIVLSGANMGPATLQRATSTPLPTTLAGTSINITVKGTTTNGIIIYTAAGQVQALLPSKTPVGNGTLRVAYNGQTSAPFPIEVVKSSFGAFTLSQDGKGTAVVQDENGQTITPLNPAAPNQTVAISGTGLGPITADETLPPPQVDMPDIPVELYVGTAKADISYLGRTGLAAGIDQINFQIPPGQVGCNVMVAVKIKNIVSNFTTLAVSSGGPCSDANGDLASAMELLSQNGSFNTGGLTLLQTTWPAGAVPGTAGPVTLETANAAFFHETLAQYTRGGVSPSVGGCYAQTLSSAQPAVPPADLPVILDAGPITLTGPNGVKNLTQVANTYIASLSAPAGPLYISPGTYTYFAAGGADVGAFTASFTVGERVKWLNQAGIPSLLDRSQDLTVTWSGGPSDGWALIAGSSNQMSGKTRIEGIFTCFAPIAAGQFTIPAFVLTSLPATSPSTTQMPGSLAVGSVANTVLPSPPGIDLANVVYMEETISAASYK